MAKRLSRRRLLETLAGLPFMGGLAPGVPAAIPRTHIQAPLLRRLPAASGPRLLTTEIGTSNALPTSRRFGPKKRANRLSNFARV